MSVGFRVGDSGEGNVRVSDHEVQLVEVHRDEERGKERDKCDFDHLLLAICDDRKERGRVFRLVVRLVDVPEEVDLVA